MSGIWAFIQAHQATTTLVTYMVFSNAVGSLPAPAIDSGGFYKFLFSFANALASNLTRAFSSKLPVATAQAVGVADAQQAQGLPIEPPRPVPNVIVPPPKVG